MAVITQPYMVDDLETLKNPEKEVPAVRTIRFGLNGVDYVIDLNAKNGAKFDKDIAPYVRAARRVKPQGRRRRGRQAGDQDLDTADVRRWARSQGIDIKTHGRIPESVIAKYKDAH